MPIVIIQARPNTSACYRDQRENMKIETNLMVALALTILFSGCESTPTPKKSVPISKDEYFSQRCASTAINQQVHQSCSFVHSQLKPIVPVSLPEHCSLTGNDCGVIKLAIKLNRIGPTSTSTLKNKVFLSCGTQWGEVIKKTYECFYDDNGGLDAVQYSRWDWN